MNLRFTLLSTLMLGVFCTLAACTQEEGAHHRIRLHQRQLQDLHPALRKPPQQDFCTTTVSAAVAISIVCR